MTRVTADGTPRLDAKELLTFISEMVRHIQSVHHPQQDHAVVGVKGIADERKPQRIDEEYQSKRVCVCVCEIRGPQKSIPFGTTDYRK